MQLHIRIQQESKNLLYLIAFTTTGMYSNLHVRVRGRFTIAFVSKLHFFFRPSPKKSFDRERKEA